MTSEFFLARIRRPLTVALVLALLFGSSTLRAQDDLMAQAELVLLGTVISKAQSASPEMSATAETAIVRLDQIVKPSKTTALHGFVGRPVTILLKDPARLGSRILLHCFL